MRTFVITALAIAAYATSNASTWADKEGNTNPHGAAYATCAKACGDCQRECDMCSTHCLSLVAKGKAEHARTMQFCQDCAALCATASAIVARMGPLSDTICRSCAEACARCGEACAKFTDDMHMKKCAEECKKCEAACRAMLKHVSASHN